MSDGLGSSLPPPPGHNQSKASSARHVAFSETSASSAPSKAHDQAIHFVPDLDDERPKRFHPGCYACCAWGCLFFFAFILLALIVGFIFVAIFHSFLPEIHIRRFNATAINFAQANKDLGVKGKVDFLVEFFNKNEKTEIRYGAFKITASSAHVQLGKTEFPEFRQGQKNTKSLNGTINVKLSGVDKEDADQLKTDIKNREVTLNLAMTGSVSFPIGGVWFKSIPIISNCDAKQKEVDFGNKAKCDYRIIAIK